MKKSYLRNFLIAKKIFLAVIFSSAVLEKISPLHAETVAVLYALEADMRELRGGRPSSASTINGTPVQMLSIGGKRVIAAQMGAGAVETAVNATNVFSKFPVDLAISIGPAGSIGDSAEKGSITLVSRVVGYQRGTWEREGWGLASAAERSIAPFDEIHRWPVPLADAAIASGEAFVARNDIREQIHRETGAEIVDMNSFGLAVAAERAKVPLVIVKIVSDAANTSAAEDFKKFVADYDGRLGRETAQFIEALPIPPESPDAYDEIRSLLKEERDEADEM